MIESYSAFYVQPTYRAYNPEPTYTADLALAYCIRCRWVSPLDSKIGSTCPVCSGRRVMPSSDPRIPPCVADYIARERDRLMDAEEALRSGLDAPARALTEDEIQNLLTSRYGAAAIARYADPKRRT